MRKISKFLLVNTFMLLASCTGNVNSSSSLSSSSSFSSSSSNSAQVESSISVSESESSSIDESSNLSSSSSEEIDYGTLTVENLFLYVNYAGKAPKYSFSKPEYEEAITYEFDSQDIKYENGVFEAINGEKSIKVTAKTTHHTDVFRIYTLNDTYEAKVATRESEFVEYGMQKHGTVFIGDSFFDTQFWSNFYTTFARKNVFTSGISATQTTDWERFAERIIYPFEPDNIVMHCGTNNIFDGKNDAATTIKDTKRLLTQLHDNLPNTKIYYFAIEPRTYAGAESQNAQCAEVNVEMEKYCNETDYLHYLASPKECFNDNGQPNANFFRDNIHPKLENYQYYVKLLEEAGIQYTSNFNKNINDINIENMNDYLITKSILYGGVPLKREFYLEGNMVISQCGNNAHIEFSFDNTNFANRFLFWDSESKGVFKMGYAINQNHVSTAPERSQWKKESGDLTLSWKLLVTSKNAYLYVGDQLELVFFNLPTTNVDFIIGVQKAIVNFNSMLAYTKADDLEQYNAKLNQVADIEALNKGNCIIRGYDL